MRSTMAEQAKLNEAQSQQWAREQYQKATKYLAEKGYVTESVTTVESRYLVPVIAVWKLKTIDKETIWVISGDLPCDHIPFSSAPDVRESLRNFSMKWQLQAQNILNSAKDKTQVDFANLLIHRAESLYQLFENDSLWNE